MNSPVDVNAVDMLTAQHEEVASLFEKLADASSPRRKQQLFEALADMLAVHVTIEERHFYPGVKKQQTEDILLESVEEHLEVKRLIADLMEMDAGDDQFEAKATVLQENVEHHVEEEETELFPKVEKLIDEEQLEAIGAAMEETQVELKREGNPRDAIPGETDVAAPI